jgi:hypothetical protein
VNVAFLAEASAVASTSIVKVASTLDSATIENVASATVTSVVEGSSLVVHDVSELLAASSNNAEVKILNFFIMH